MSLLGQRFRSCCRLLIAAGMLLAGIPGHGDVASEAQLKAAYLVNFLKYVDWPSNQGPINICLFGRDSLGPYLATYEGRQIAGRELRVRRVTAPDQIAECNELFIPETEEARIPVVLRWTEKQPILTVSDAEIFAREGGGIALVRNEGRLQFDINTSSLAKANLKAQSQMLRLARQVIGGNK